MTTAALVTLNETHKGLLILWSYKFNSLMMLFRLSVLFVVISLFVGKGQLDQGALAPTLLGYLVWFYAAIAVSNMSWNLMEEAQAGTLEQMYMSPAPTSVMVVGRCISSVVSSTLMVLLIGTGLAVALGVRIPMNWEGLPVFAVTMVGLFGFGFMIAGATLVFKQVQQLANLADTFLLWLSGALLPVHFFPGWLEAFSRALPTTQGIIVLRNVVLDGQSLSSALADGSLAWLVLNSALYFVFGWVIFKWCERIAKQRGSLGQY